MYSDLDIFTYEELVNPKTILDRIVLSNRRYVEVVSLRNTLKDVLAVKTTLEGWIPDIAIESAFSEILEEREDIEK